MNIRNEIAENNKLYVELQALSAKIKQQDIKIKKAIAEQYNYRIYLDDKPDSESEDEIWFDRNLYSKDVWKLFERNLITYVKENSPCKNKRTIVGKHHLMVNLVNADTSIVLHDNRVSIQYRYGYFGLTNEEFVKLYKHEDRDKLLQLFVTDKETADIALAILLSK